MHRMRTDADVCCVPTPTVTSSLLDAANGCCCTNWLEASECRGVASCHHHAEHTARLRRKWASGRLSNIAWQLEACPVANPYGNHCVGLHFVRLGMQTCCLKHCDHQWCHYMFWALVTQANTCIHLEYGTLLLLIPVQLYQCVE